MKNLFFIKALAIVVLLSCKSPDVSFPMNTTHPASARKLIWADEFDKPGLPDSTKWKYEVGGNGWGNNELQYYTAKRTENARVKNGKLIIEARKEDYQGKSYTSARLSTQGKQAWKYGRIEALAKLPKGVGTWPAIWMLGNNISTSNWPTCGEIDIMEHVGFDENVIHGTLHTEAYNHGKHTEKGDTLRVSNVTSGFHLYAVEWTASQIDFLVDNQKFYSVRKADLGNTEAQWPFDQSFFLILNVAVGGKWGGRQGIDERIWPQRMEVDYVRVYQ